MRSFHYTFFAQEIVFGRGSLGQLGDLTKRYGWRRLTLCATAGARARGMLAPIEALLGERLVATYERVQGHVPESDVTAATDIAAQHDADAIIAFGGGSAIGVAKAASLALEERRIGRPARAAYPTDQPLIPTIAIPTTYAGSEITPVYGVTREVDGVSNKITVTDPKITPKLVIYDPLLTLDLPPRATAGTGINAVAHCIEALYSITSNPLSSAAALGGLRALSRSLVSCCENGSDIEAREEALTGAFLAGTALSNVAMGLHHGVCHVIGGATGAAHGDANSVMLSHVMRFNLDATAPQLAQAAEAMGIPVSGHSAEEAAASAAQMVADWVEQMRLPRRLREIGVQEEMLPELARMAFASRTVHNNPKPLTDVAQIEALLREAW
ncbi:MAG TPA: iron-containing alcohol dehydrogenase family protein [Ktedonobacterales bacterium]|nr:iron-containing alcohol dehydrogenase family protein [Ktedonobacterales bacterium]